MIRAPAFATVLLFGVLAGCDNKQASNTTPPQPSVTVSKPLQKTITEWDEYTGRFEALATVDVRARVSGFIDSIHFDDGQIVKQGDLLFVIDPRPYGLAVEQAKADVERAQSKLEIATSDVERAAPLVRSQTLSGREFDTRKSVQRDAAGAVGSAEATLKQAELNLEWTEVHAPIGGRISDKRVDAGNLITGGTTGTTLLTSIVTLDPIHFIFDASEADFIRYLRLANVVSARTGTIRGRAIFDNKDGLLTPGFFGRLRLFGGTVDALLIPDGAIASDQASKIVFTVADDGTVGTKKVELGPIVDGLRVVRSGLTANDRIVVEGLARARPGQKVTPENGTIKAAEK
jgi:multidrug efflux pump subunit AcrA (membrane-fusion protein)